MQVFLPCRSPGDFVVPAIQEAYDLDPGDSTESEWLRLLLRMKAVRFRDCRSLANSRSWRKIRSKRAG